MDYRETSLCILSSDCNLYICDGDHDDSTDRWVTCNNDKNNRIKDSIPILKYKKKLHFNSGRKSLLILCDKS